MEKNKFTIGLPIYNESKTLRKTLDAIMENLDAVDYVLILDNDSTDATPDICQEYCKRSSKIRYYKNKKNIGSWQNMVKLLKRVDTEFYMQLGGHDYLSPGSIQRLRGEMKEDVACCFGKVVNQIKNNPIKDTYLKYTDQLQSDIASERFVAYLLTTGSNRAYYGIMRTKTLKEAMALYGHYTGIATDNVICAYMALKGKFIYVSDVKITVKAVKMTQKEIYQKYRKFGMDVPYINPGKQFYKYIVQLAYDDENARKQINYIEKILNDKYGAYGSDFQWLLRNYKHIC